MFDKHFFSRYTYAYGMKHSLFFLFPLLFFLFIACADTDIQEDSTESSYSRITITKKYFLLPTDYITDTVSFAGRIAVTYRKQTSYAKAFIQADKTRFFLTIDNADFNNTDSVKGSLLYENGRITSGLTPLTEKINPEYFAADFQFCFYNVSAVAGELAESNLRFTVETKNGGTVEIRRIYHYSRCIEEIVKKQNSIQVTNYYRGYSYTLQEDSE